MVVVRKSAFVLACLEHQPFSSVNCHQESNLDSCDWYDNLFYVALIMKDMLPLVSESGFSHHEDPTKILE